jgi:hypothetical protein
MKPQPVKVTATLIRSAMEKRWASPEYAIMWEVGEATGALAGRRADAVIMSLWPSRGLELHGIEIKVSRTDWKRESADPGKAEAIGRFCDRWWVHTSPGVVQDLSEMPPAWGLREWNGKTWATRKEAEKTEAEQVTKPFLAAMLRRADGTMRALMKEARLEAEDQLRAENDRRRERFQDEVKRAVERRTTELAQNAEAMREFEEAFGEGALRDWGVDRKALGRAALALHRCRIGHYVPGEMPKLLREAADRIEAVSQLLVPQADDGGPVLERRNA